MAKGDMIEVTGVVTEVLRGTNFKVKLDQVDKTINATLSGKLRTNFIRILQGDKVTVSMSPYDTERGRIIWRSK